MTLPTDPLLRRRSRARADGLASRKGAFPADPRGRWTVDVVTASGQLIGRLRLRVDA